MERIDGGYLKRLREESGLSLRALADKLFVSKSSLQRWEKSFLPEDEALLTKLGEVFGVSVEHMRRRSAELSAGLSPDRLAEVRFGTRGLVIALCTLGALVVAGVIVAALFF